MSGPATSTGCCAASMRAASARTTSGSAPARPVTVRLVTQRTSPSSTSAVQSSIGIETNAGPFGRQRGPVDALGDRCRDIGRARGLEGPLDVGVHDPSGVAVGQVGLHGDLRADLLAGGDQQRRVVGLGVEQGAHRVADAGRGVQVDVGRPSSRPARSRRPCRRPPPPGDRARSGSPTGSRRASAAPSIRGCRRSWSCRAAAAARTSRHAPWS